MNFERLRVLTAVARTGSVRGAAAALDVTPGAVSKAMARLEVEAGVPLLVPAGRGVELTDDGAWLARRAELLVGEFASIGTDLSNRRGRAAELCLATHDVWASWFVATLASQYLPSVPLSVRERWPGEVEQAVADGVSDVGVTWMPVATDGVEHVEVARVRLVVAVRRGSPMLREPVAELPFAVPSHPVSGATAQYGPLDGWPADAPLRDARFRVSSLEARMDLCAAGHAAVVVPAFVLAEHNARAKAARQLMPHPGPTPLGRARRRVHLVRRVGAPPQVRQRCDAVLAAVRAVCVD